jgi:hypothetical protein
MDRQSATHSGLTGVQADLVYLARDGRAVLSPHGAFEDPTAPADVLPRESIELRTIAFHAS